jgi:hypothetical protein
MLSVVRLRLRLESATIGVQSHFRPSCQCAERNTNLRCVLEPVHILPESDSHSFQIRAGDRLMPCTTPRRNSGLLCRVRDYLHMSQPVPNTDTGQGGMSQQRHFHRTVVHEDEIRTAFKMVAGRAVLFIVVPAICPATHTPRQQRQPARRWEGRQSRESAKLFASVRLDTKQGKKPDGNRLENRNCYNIAIARIDRTSRSVRAMVEGPQSTWEVFGQL